LQLGDAWRGAPSAPLGDGTQGHLTLLLDLRWKDGGCWYAVQGGCQSGITVLEGPALDSLFRLLAGEHLPYAGKVMLDGSHVLEGTARPRSLFLPPVVRVTEPDGLPHWQTATRLVRAQVRAQGPRDAAAQARTMQALGWMGIASLGWRPIGSLALEQRARVAIAEALVRVPGLLLWRPPAGLAPQAGAALCETIGALMRRWGSVALIASEEGMPCAPCLQVVRVV